ncbi:MAG: phosphoglucosamine mutase [Planctomycetes bacterium]|nr:phosphoglucosamine mutase [Planctomycetota bacterium]
MAAGEPAKASEWSIFGTDGVRDRAREGLLSPSSVERIAGATVSALREKGAFPEDFPPGRGGAVAIARDTRESGEDLCRQISEVFSRLGHAVVDLGVLPTPGAAWVASAWPEVLLGVVVSASHNPAEYNGIKLVAPTGAKISPGFEAAVSAAYRAGEVAPSRGAPGRIEDRSATAFEEYATWLAGSCRRPERLRGRVVALDGANGAACRVAPEVFRRLGMDVRSIGVSPDGRNINLECGALEPERLARHVVDVQACVGFCFDGDGDRVIPVTSGGRVLNGDHVLFLAGRRYHEEGRLPRRTVVATVMSNVGLEIALASSGLELLRTDVGDRNVYLAMVAGGHPLGGEQSGHLIFLDDSATGDGVLAALRLLDVLDGSLDLEAEASAVKSYPQVLKNVRVREKVPLDALPAVAAAVEAAEARLGGEGRVVLRYSGTEPLARVMLEGPDAVLVESLADSICAAIRRSLPGSA